MSEEPTIENLINKIIEWNRNNPHFQIVSIEKVKKRTESDEC